MTILKNSRHEKFALALFQGMTQKDAAIEAGYKPSRAIETGSDLVINRNIMNRIAELHQLATSKLVMTVQDVKERLSEIGRADLTDFVKDGEPELEKETPNRRAAAEFYIREGYNKQGDPVITKSIKLHNPITAMAELSKLRGDYAPEKHPQLGDIVIEVVYVDRDKNKIAGRVTIPAPTTK